MCQNQVRYGSNNRPCGCLWADPCRCSKPQQCPECHCGPCRCYVDPPSHISVPIPKVEGHRYVGLMNVEPGMKYLSIQDAIALEEPRTITADMLKRFPGDTYYQGRYTPSRQRWKGLVYEPCAPPLQKTEAKWHPNSTYWSVPKGTRVVFRNGVSYTKGIEDIIPSCDFIILT